MSLFYVFVVNRKSTKIKIREGKLKQPLEFLLLQYTKTFYDLLKLTPWKSKRELYISVCRINVYWYIQESLSEVSS